MHTYLEKIVETDPYLVSKTGSVEPTVRLLDYDSLSMEKVASEALEYSKHVKKEPGKTSILVLAMGASEYYGPNRNGDAFRESELIKHHHTFETNAHVFKSHVNKDPAKAIGKVLKSFYNHDMHRVEIIMQLDDALCPEIVDKVKAQKDVAVSMGCRIKYDVCSICGNKAPTRAQYCKHLQYEMNDIYPDGRVVCADNPSPNFFDISVVYRPADKTGYMLKKVAFAGGARERGQLSTDLAAKAASLTVIAKYLDKAADIDKTIEGVGFGLGANSISTSSELPESEKQLSVKWLRTITPKVVDSYKSLSDGALADMSTASLTEAIKALTSHGVFLMTSDFLDLVFLKLTGSKAPEGLSNKLVSLQSDILRVLSKHPEIPASAFESGSVPVDMEVGEMDKEARLNVCAISGNPLARASRRSELVEKVAGLACIANAAYVASLCSASSHDFNKVAAAYGTDYTAGSRMNKLSYLQHRAFDLIPNYRVRASNSSVKVAGDINLFKSDIDRYLKNLGRALLNS
jgi:hypothetical protein